MIEGRNSICLEKGEASTLEQSWNPNKKQINRTVPLGPSRTKRKTSSRNNQSIMRVSRLLDVRFNLTRRDGQFVGRPFCGSEDAL